jgi:hypothetical protein
MKSEFFAALVGQSPSLVVQEWVIDRTPTIFPNHVDYVKWKSTLGEMLEVDGRAICLVGSASVGFSLNPTKGFSDFSAESDIDVAVVSSRHFDIAWHALRALGTARYKLTPAQRASVEDHRSRLVYWGAFDTKHLLPVLPFGRGWLEAFEKMTSMDPTRDRHVSGRIYRDFESLSAYHSNNIRKLRETRLAGGA